jgi:hypothetical protein
MFKHLHTLRFFVLFCASVTLFCPRLYATPYDVVVSEDGKTVSFQLEGFMSGLVNGFVPGKSATVSVVSPGYSGAGLGSTVREIDTHYKELVSFGGEFADNFVGPAGTPLHELTPLEDISGNGWTQQLGVWGVAQAGMPGVSAGVMEVDASADAAIATVDIGKANASVGVRSLQRPSNRANGLVFRFSDTQNYWSLVVRDNQNSLVLVRRQGGSETVVQSMPIQGYDRFTQYILGVETSGTSISVTMDGIEVMSVQHAFNQNASMHGIISTHRTNGFHQLGAFRVNEQLGFEAILALTEPIYAADSQVLLSLEEGIFTDGIHSSTEAVEIPGTNQSTREYDPPAGGLIGVFVPGSDGIQIQYSVVAGMLTAEAQFTHWAGIGGVEFSITDGSNTQSVVATARTRSQHRDDAIVTEQEFSKNGGGRFYYQGQLNLGALSDGLVELTVTAYPACGNATSLRQETWELFNNSGGSVASAMQSISPAGGWNWSAASAYGGGPGSPPTLYVHSTQGSDQGGSGTQASPYQSIGHAIGRLLTLGAGAWANVVLLDEGPHLNRRINATLITYDSWVRISGATPGAQIIYDQTSPEFPQLQFFRTSKQMNEKLGVKMSNLILNLDYGQSLNSIWMSKGSELRDSRGHWHAGLTGPLVTFSWNEAAKRIECNEPGQFLGLDYAASMGLDTSSLHVVGGSEGVISGIYPVVNWDSNEGRWVELGESITGGAGNAPSVLWGRGRRIITTERVQYFTDCKLNHVASGPSSAGLVRNVSSRGISLDWIQEPRFVIACRVTDFFGAHSGSHHADVVQLVHRATNMVIDGLHANTDSETQLFFFENAPIMGGDLTHRNWAIINSIFIRETPLVSAAPFMQIPRSNYNFVISANTIVGQRLLFRSGGDGFVAEGGAITNNVFDLVSESPNMHCAIIRNNHFVSGEPISLARGSTTGGSMMDVMEDPVGGDLNPKGPAINRVQVSWFEGDLYGRPVLTDGSGAIGAVQPGDAVAPVEKLPPSSGTIAALPAFVGPGPLQLSYSGAAPGSDPLAEVRLWVRKGQGSWQATNQASASPQGVFVYEGLDDEVLYRFSLQAKDTDGGTSPTPTGGGMVMTTLDATPPSTGTVTVPEYFTSAPLSVSYSGVSDAGSGLETVRLWARVGAGSWAYTGLSSSFDSDTFSFPAPGDGAYAFAIQTVDKAGNTSPVPTGAGAATILDSIPPSIGTLSGPSSTNSSPVTLNYSGVSDAQSGIDFVQLWARKPGGSWGPTGLSSNTASGSFQYAGLDSPGDYAFALRTRDKAGNTSSTPSGNGQLALYFSNIPPAIGAVTSPPYANSTPITVEYAGDSSIDTASLWVRRGGGAWQATGMTLGGASGVFNFDGVTGEGSYAFAVQVSDTLGNTSATPTGSGMATTVYDTTAPQPGTVSAPSLVNETPISVLYSGASDGNGSGIDRVELWASKDGGPWSATGLTKEGTSGNFAFPAAAGDGVYAFALRARDRAGNESPQPSGDGLAQTTLDTTFSPGKLTAPEFATETPITLSYSDAKGTGESGSVTVHLWVKAGEDAAWQETGMSATGESGSFSFEDVDQDGPYYFALQAENDEGERSAAPQTLGQASTFYDTTPPEWSIDSPAVTRELPIAIDYFATDGDGSGVKEVRIWVKQGVNGDWEDTGLVLTEEEGTIEYDAIEEDDAYFFAIQVTDQAGLQSPVPTDALIGDLLAQAD